MAGPRVLHVITRSDWGGAQRIVQLLATRAAGDAAVACGPGGTLIDRLTANEIPVHVQPHLKSPPDPVADSRALVDLCSLLRRNSFDVVHCHSTKAGALGRFAAAATRTSRLFTVHGWGFYNVQYNWLEPILTTGERLLTRLSDTVVCVSENDRTRARERGIFRNGDGIVIHNGIPPLTPDSGRSTVETELGVDPNKTIVGAIARLSKQKNPLAIVRAAERVQADNHDVTLVLLGTGPLSERCKRYAHNHDVDAHIPGFRDDALELLADIDVFLLPSRFEGLPLTTLEAMHLGIPVVAYDVGGVSEAVSDGDSGFVVPKGSFERFVQSVEQLVVDRTQREQFSRRAHERARAQFTAARMIDEYETLYERFR